MTTPRRAALSDEDVRAGVSLPGNSADREAMDLYNNEVGRQIALAHPDASRQELADLVAGDIETATHRHHRPQW